MAKATAKELEEIVRESHRKLMLKKKEKELREYLKRLPYNKKPRTQEYQELKKIVYDRHNKENINKFYLILSKSSDLNGLLLYEFIKIY